MFLAPPADVGYAALFGLIFAESSGLPVPGETALLAAGVLAGAGRMALATVIGIAAAAAILGDNLGFVLGRRGWRRLLLRGGRTERWRRRSIAEAERFFARHGHRAVFLARWVPVARYLTPLTAGAALMPWRRFLAYNAAGAIAWCALLPLLAAVAGPAAAASVSGLGLAATAAAALAAAARGIAARRRATPASASA
jgi:membrane protein DedA with SNARE-associated domain